MGYQYSRGRAAIDGTLDAWGQLAVCIVIDVIGAFAMIVPELGNLACAPFEGIWIYTMLSQDHYVFFVSAFGVIEEAILGINVIPGCTIAWLYKYWR